MNITYLKYLKIFKEMKISKIKIKINFRENIADYSEICR